MTILGPSDAYSADVEEALTLAPVLVAADGGATRAIELGKRPDRVIGDFDSVDAATLAGLPPEALVRIAEQDSTDFEKCLQRLDAPLMIAVGFTGGRIDHGLAVCSALARYPGRRCIVLSAEDVMFHAPRRITLDLAPGTRVSLFPMTGVSGRSSGLRWPIGGLEFSPTGRIGTSNIAEGPVALEFAGDGMLIILPRSDLRAAAVALTA